LRDQEGGGVAAPGAELRVRVRRFASLRAAQRALGTAVHPSELERANQLGRAALIDLERLRVEAEEQGQSLAPVALAQVDGRLDDIASHARATLARLDVPALRNALTDLAGENLVEAQGLIDLLIEPGVPDGDGLRTLEYLVTLASTEERHGRRVVVREVSGLSARLRDFSQTLTDDPTGEALEAERLFSSASVALHSENDLGGVRDRMRALKEELGAKIFHPRVLAAAVSYNVAMWNRVADLVEGSRSIDLLATDLLVTEASAGAPDAVGEAADPPRAPSTTEVLDTRGFGRLVAAVGARLRGGSSDDTAADRCAVAASREGLRPGEVEVFDQSADTDPAALLARSAIVVGLVLRYAAALEAPLAELDLDPETLRQAAPALAEEMAALSRKLFDADHHDEAFLLSEVRSRHLAGRLASEVAGGFAAPKHPRVGGRVSEWLPGVKPGMVAALAVLFVLALVVSLLWSPGRRADAYTAEQLAAISPFLESGYRNELGETQEFIGRLTPAWDYLKADQRQRVTAEIGVAMAERGVVGVVLKDRWNRVHARYARGRPLLVDPLRDGPGGS